MPITLFTIPMGISFLVIENKCRMETFKVVVLILSASALFYASSMRLFNPSKANFLQTYTENSTNTLVQDVDLLNEIRGVGSVMLLGGIVILLGVFMPGLRRTSLVVAGVIFVGVVLGRIVSISLDGTPNTEVMKATMAEVVLGALNVFFVVKDFTSQD